MVGKEKQQEHLKAFEIYFPSHNRKEGALKEIKKDLAELSKITDPEKQYQAAELALRKYIYNQGIAYSHFNNGKLYELGISTLDTLDEYDKLIKELREINTKAAEKLKATQCAYCQTKNLINPTYLK